MSITIPSGVTDAGSGDEPVGDRRHPLAPAVVYLAAARNTYRTLVYRRAVQRVAEWWPQSALMDADSCGFASRADWHMRWPFIRDGIDGLVVLSEDDGTISHDTWLELRDATDRGLPCWFVRGDGDLLPASSIALRLYPTGVRTARRWARAQVVPAR